MPKKRATIAHISDLHMNRKVDRSVTDMLKRLLQRIRPNILIVSGDLANQPVPWQMKKAAKLVQEIETSCAPTRVIVIPGNHDLKFWGNVGLRRLTRIPFEIYFRNYGLNHGVLWRCAEAFKLLLNALYWKGHAMREPVIVDLFPTLGVALFAVNSNTLAEMMAAGKVESRDLQEIYAKCDDVEKSFEFFYKVAVVHHHPAPIADAPTGAIARIQDSFMIFYNAGLFVRELSRRGFNLILHGHKHVAGFLRIGCEFKDQGRTVLPIAAAGTACHPVPDDSRGHHLHVVEIFDDDTAWLDSWFFSANDERKEDVSYRYKLDTLEDVRRRRYVIFSRLQKYSSNEIRKSVNITRDGYTSVQIDYCENRVLPGEGLERIPLSLTTERPSYLRAIEPAPGLSAFVKINRRKQCLHKFEGNLELGQKWWSESGPFHYGYSYRLMNGHVLTAEEFARHYSGTKLDSEFASMTCDGACELMTLNVQFPHIDEVNSLEFRAIAEYVAAPLRGILDDRLDRGEAKRHDEETERIKGNIRQESNGYILTCPNPVPGMIYKLCWEFKKRSNEPKVELSVAADVSEVRRKLLSMAMTSSKDSAGRAAWDIARSILDALEGDINSKLPGTREQFYITVMVFDEDSQRLKFVCSNTEPEAIPSGEFLAGEGCAGFVFEKARYILYHPTRDPIGYFIRRDEFLAEELPAGQQKPEPVVLASFPWIHNQADEQRRIVVGVVNVSSSLATTKMLALFNPSETEQERKMKMLHDLVALTTNRLFQLTLQM